jgi:D-glycerate 3-kinase
MVSTMHPTLLSVSLRQVAIPRYDKSQQDGQGDRAPQQTWPVKRGAVDVVLFEGWMLGFPPFSDSKKVTNV